MLESLRKVNIAEPRVCVSVLGISSYQIVKKFPEQSEHFHHHMVMYSIRSSLLTAWSGLRWVT